MSLLNDLKKIFFGAQSVARSSAERAAEAAREAERDFRANSTEYADQARRQADQFRAEAREAFDGGSEKAKSALSDFADKLREEVDYATQQGRELKAKAEDWLHQRETRNPPPTVSEFENDHPTDTPVTNSYSDPMSDLRKQDKPRDDDEPRYNYEDLVTSNDPEPPLTERPVGAPPTEPKKDPIDFEADLDTPPPPREPSAFDDVLDKAARAGNEARQSAERLGRKVMDLSEEIGGKILEKGGDALHRAADAGGRLRDRADDLVERARQSAERESMDETIRRAKEAEEQAAARARAFGNKESERSTKDSTLGGMDDFFSRAQRFADGDYHNEGGKPMRVQENPDYKPKEKGTEYSIPGFEDHDGDGDDLIDDAILDDDDNDKK